MWNPIQIGLWESVGIVAIAPLPHSAAYFHTQAPWPHLQLAEKLPRLMVLVDFSLPSLRVRSGVAQKFMTRDLSRIIQSLTQDCDQRLDRMFLSKQWLCDLKFEDILVFPLVVIRSYSNYHRILWHHHPLQGTWTYYISPSLWLMDPEGFQRKLRVVFAFLLHDLSEALDTAWNKKAAEALYQSTLMWPFPSHGSRYSPGADMKEKTFRVLLIF